jgi:hypothetical protein
MENGYRQLTQSDIISVDSTQQNQLGAVGQTEDGRKFVYALIGGTSAVAPGTLLVQPAAPANSTGLAISASNTSAQLSAGSFSILLTNGSTAVAQDQFKEGFLEVLQTSGSNNGPQSYRIAGNSAAGNGGVITVSLADPLVNSSALVAGTDTASLVLSPYAGAVASTTASLYAGVLRAQVVNTASVSNYAWLQVGGLGLITLDATTGGITLGAGLYQSTTTAGAVSKTAPTLSNGTAVPLGIARSTVAASGQASVYLQICY